MTLFLTGCMGAGKSTVGRLLARKLGRAFIDLDDEIAQTTGMRPGEIIERMGEAAFREIESKLLRRLALGDGRVVALGGGTLGSQENLDLVRGVGELVYLEATPEVLVGRLDAAAVAARPLLRGDPLEQMRNLVESRAPVYEQADRRVATNGRDASEIASELAKSVPDLPPDAEPFEELKVLLGANTYSILLGAGQRWRLGEAVAERVTHSRAALIVDGALVERYAAEAELSLRRAGFEVTTVVVPPGESSKSLEELARVQDELLAAGLDRELPIIALGGGVVGDLAGFAAATLLRGMPLVQVPTTLLAQVDSSVGGKTGINHARGKNLVGAFHQPILVFIDTSYLRTLAPRDLRAGLAEVVKYGVIADGAFFAFLEKEVEALVDAHDEILVRAIRRSCEIKAEFVAADERETKGLRAHLNFGHTLGHALERVTGFDRLRHGEAVAVGMVLAAQLSERLGLCNSIVVRRIETLLRQIGLPTHYPYQPEELVEAASADKKALRGEIHFILVEDLGRVRQVPLEPRVLLELLRGLS